MLKSHLAYFLSTVVTIKYIFGQPLSPNTKSQEYKFLSAILCLVLAKFYVRIFAVELYKCTSAA